MEIGRMTAAQVDRELEAHDLVEHDLEDPGWNRRSAQILHRKITLSCRRPVGEKPRQGDQTAPSGQSNRKAGHSPPDPAVGSTTDESAKPATACRAAGVLSDPTVEKREHPRVDSYVLSG